jgi:hypothetical protein
LKPNSRTWGEHLVAGHRDEAGVLAELVWRTILAEGAGGAGLERLVAVGRRQRPLIHSTSEACRNPGLARATLTL